nr:hypothetical protein [Tanacetum cinerariifolium]
TRRKQTPPPTNPNNMTPEAVQTMIDQALLMNYGGGDGSYSSTRRKQTPPPTNPNNPNNMTPEAVQTMIDQALLMNYGGGDGSYSSHAENPRNMHNARPCYYADFMKCHPLNFKGT